MKDDRINYISAVFGGKHLVICSTAHGICHIEMLPLSTDIAAYLSKLHGNAMPAVDPSLRDILSRILFYLKTGDDTGLSAIKLDVCGTQFQRNVWSEIMKIKRGQVISYGELARRIGNPSAARAVAGACASNPVPFIIPCHRVIRGNGQTGGYGLGPLMKRRLLKLEGAIR
jgi:AraC family transcriptional regulator of adaptative response/methylated-DNA-[protein]-cysteine methyltransferase